MRYFQTRYTVLFSTLLILSTFFAWPALKPMARAANSSSPTAPPLTAIGKLSGAIISVGLQGTIAVLGDEQGIVLVDVSDPSASVQISRLPLGGQIKDLFVRNNLVYAGSSNGLFQVVDITNPFEPRLRGQLTDDLSGEGIDIVGNYAAIAGNSGLFMVDVRNPDIPTLLGKADPVLGGYRDARYIGKYVYTASSGLEIFDVSNPAQPTRIGYYQPRSDTMGEIVAVDVQGSFAYLAINDGGLAVVDIHTPTAPQLVAYLDLPGYSAGIQVVNNKVYLASADFMGGLKVVDISNPQKPRLTGALDTAGYANRLLVVGNLVYLADWSGGLVIIDVSTAAPTQRGLYGVGGWSTKMVQVGDRLYISSAEGLVIADVSIPNRPYVLSALELPGIASTLAVTGTTVFLGNDLRRQDERVNDWNITAVDATDPTKPKILSTMLLTQTQLWDMAIIGTTLYTASYNGLLLVDMANPAQPHEIGMVANVGRTSFIVVEGTLAYLSSDVVLDVRTPAAPTIVAQLDLPDGYVRDVKDSLVYIAENERVDSPIQYPRTPQYESTFKIADARDPSMMQKLGAYTPNDGLIFDIKVQDSIAYVLTANGIHVVDVHDPTNPTLLTTESIPSRSSLLVNDTMLLAIGEEKGVQLYATSQLYVPRSAEVRGDTTLTSANDAVELHFGGKTMDAGMLVTHMDRFTSRQSASAPRDIDHSFLVEARSASGTTIWQATTPYTLEVTIPPHTASSTTHPGVAYWNGVRWVDLPPCTECGTQSDKMIVQTDHFGELAIVLDAPASSEQSSATPTATPTSSPVALPVEQSTYRLFVPFMRR